MIEDIIIHGFGAAQDTLGEVFPSDFQFPEIPGLENLEVRSLDAKLAQFNVLEEEFSSLLEMYREFAPPGDPDLEALENAVAYCNTMEAGLEDLRGEIEDFQAPANNPDASAPDIMAAERALHEKFLLVRTPGLNGLGLADSDTATAWYQQALGFYMQGQPGDVIYIDPQTGVRSWVSLDKLLEFKEGTINGIPLSTSYAFWEYYKTVLENSGPVGLDDIRVRITEGYEPLGEHADGSSHDEGRAIDFGFADKVYTSDRIAHMIMAGEATSGVEVYYEVKVSADATTEELDAIMGPIRSAVKRVLMGEYGMTASEARSLVNSNIRPIPWASANHFHFEDDGPVVQALKG